MNFNKFESETVNCGRTNNYNGVDNMDRVKFDRAGNLNHVKVNGVGKRKGKVLRIRYDKYHGYTCDPQYYLDDELHVTTIGAVEFDDFVPKVHDLLCNGWITNLDNKKGSAFIPNNYPYTSVLFTESFIAKLNEDYPGVDLAEVEAKIVPSEIKLNVEDSYVDFSIVNTDDSSVPDDDDNDCGVMNVLSKLHGNFEGKSSLRVKPKFL